jgi:hypothetical protein
MSLILRDDTGYFITFSFSEDGPADKELEIARSVVAGWQRAS